MRILCIFMRSNKIPAFSLGHCHCWLSDFRVRLAWLLIIFTFFVHFCLLIWVGFHVCLNKILQLKHLLTSWATNYTSPVTRRFLQDLSQLGIAGCISEGVCVNKIISMELSRGRSEWLMLLALIWQGFKRRVPRCV